MKKEPEASDPQKPAGPATERGARWWPWFALVLVWTLFIDLGRFHESTNADTVIPVLVSLLKWTPFYWEQDRYGMLVPLLATPIKSPLLNFVFQSGCTIWAGLACFFLLARYFFRVSLSPTIATVAIGWFLLFSDPEFPFAWLSITMFYGPALALGLGAFQLVEAARGWRGWVRWILALTMMALAHWINFTIGILLLMLFSARALGDPTRELGDRALARPGDWRSFVVVRLRALLNTRLLLLAFGVAAGRLIMTAAPPAWRQTGGYQVLPLREWFAGWKTAMTSRDYGFGPWVTYALVGMVVALLVRWRFPRARTEARPGAALAGICAAVAYGLIVEATLHARGGGFPARYLVPTAGILCVLGVGIGVTSVWPLFTARLRRLVPPAVALATSGAVLLRFGTPSLDKVRTTIGEHHGARTEELVAAQCTHVIGWYYDVWPSVLHSMIVFHDRGEHRMIWAIGHRATPTMEQWKQVPVEELKLCSGKLHPEDVPIFAAAFALPRLHVVDERSSILVWDGDRSALRAWAK